MDILLPIICFLFLIITILLLTLVSIRIATRNRRRYERTEYFRSTGNSYLQVAEDRGLMGEYLTYMELRHWENRGARFIFNAWLPRRNGKRVEVDLIMISEDGIFVIESKNRGGIIEGYEDDENWIQTLPAPEGAVRRHLFYNPIMQNDYHVDVLEKIIGYDWNVYSIVVFSDRSHLKVEYGNWENLVVLRRDQLAAQVEKIHRQNRKGVKLSQRQVDSLYNKIYSASFS